MFGLLDKTVYTRFNYAAYISYRVLHIKMRVDTKTDVKSVKRR